MCVSQRESVVSRDGDVAGNSSASAARSQQLEPPLHGPRLSPPSYSPSISLPAPHFHLQPSASRHPSHREGGQRALQVTVLELDFEAVATVNFIQTVSSLLP
ncbi:hypothetical protein ATANTOWER_004968 [Ataeniobius toweri]|uniref:Uncharacterized protein n=1 Tax=Ataeniobius toweri TaxID=208326 RepID=A0ABU7A546_9TELE|nr:hypothetical protein [Ataeniobius toweri]